MQVSVEDIKNYLQKRLGSHPGYRSRVKSGSVSGVDLNDLVVELELILNNKESLIEEYFSGKSLDDIPLGTLYLVTLFQYSLIKLEIFLEMYCTMEKYLVTYDTSTLVTPVARAEISDDKVEAIGWYFLLKDLLDKDGFFVPSEYDRYIEWFIYANGEINPVYFFGFDLLCDYMSEYIGSPNSILTRKGLSDFFKDMGNRVFNIFTEEEIIGIYSLGALYINDSMRDKILESPLVKMLQTNGSEFGESLYSRIKVCYENGLLPPYKVRLYYPNISS